MDPLHMSDNTNDDNPSETSASVNTTDNSIYFYTAVDASSVLTLTQEIESISTELSISAIKLNRPSKPDPIYLHINSFGGHLLGGFSGYEAVRHSKVPVTTIIDGYAASAATLISIAGHHRIIRPNAYILIHQLSTECWGPYDHIKTQVENCDRFMKNVKDLYLKHTKLSSKKLDK